MAHNKMKAPVMRQSLLYSTPRLFEVCSYSSRMGLPSDVRHGIRRQKDETLCRKNAAVIAPRCSSEAEGRRALSADSCFAEYSILGFVLKQCRYPSKTSRPPHIMEQEEYHEITAALHRLWA